MQAQVLEGGRGQAARVALLAGDDHFEVVTVGERQPGVATRVEAPFEDVALDDQRAGDLAVLGALGGRPVPGASTRCWPKRARGWTG